jgi:transcriptional regulator with XRE-family HTH domain
MIRDYDAVDHALPTFLSEIIRQSSCTLDELHLRTGIDRSKLGRIRQARGKITYAQAMRILEALDRPARADMLLLSLGITWDLSREGRAFIDQFLIEMPTLCERLSALGGFLNPRWARGSVLKLAEVLEQHAERRRAADLFDLGGSDPRK